MKPFLHHLLKIIYLITGSALLITAYQLWAQNQPPEKITETTHLFTRNISFLAATLTIAILCYWVAKTAATLSTPKEEYDKLGWAQTKTHPTITYLTYLWARATKRATTQNVEAYKPYAGHTIAPTFNSAFAEIYTADSRYLRDWVKDLPENTVTITETLTPQENKTPKITIPKPLKIITAIIAALAAITALMVFTHGTQELPIIILRYTTTLFIGYTLAEYIRTELTPDPKLPEIVLPYPHRNITLHTYSPWHLVAANILSIVDYTTRTGRSHREAVERIELALRGYVFTIPTNGTYKSISAEEAYQWAREELYPNSLLTPDVEAQDPEPIGQWQIKQVA